MNLIQLAKKDPKAFAELYEAHVDMLYQFVAFRVRTVQDAEDLTSQIWEKVFNKIASLHTNEDLGFKCWLFQIARNTLRDYYRQRAPFLSLDPEAQVMSHAPDPHEQIQTTDEHQELKRLVQSLPNKQKETVLLSLMSELKNKEIAALLHLSEKTVASNLSRGLQFLRSHWKNMQ